MKTQNLKITQRFTSVFILCLSFSLLLLANQSKAQTQIYGTITDCASEFILSGVNITANNGSTEYSTQSASDGTYTLELDPGTYYLNFYLAGYYSVAMSGVVIETNTNLEINKILCAFPYPVILVNAEINDTETQATINYSQPSGHYELKYDDSYPSDFVATLADGYVAVKFSVLNYPVSITGSKFFVGDGSFPEGSDFLGKKIVVCLFDDDGIDNLPGTLLDFDTITVNNFGWVEADSIFDYTLNEGEFYIALKQISNTPDLIPIGVDNDLPLSNRSYSKTSDEWEISPYQDLTIRAYVAGEIVQQRNSSDISHLYLYRISGFNPSIYESPEFGNATLLPSQFGVLTDDLTFVSDGIYAYAIEKVYENGDHSQIAYSNTLIVGMKNNIEITTHLCCESSCNDINVSLIGRDYPFLDLSSSSDMNCSTLFEDVISGNYKITVSKEGYEDYVLDEVYISTDTSFTITLQENTSPPAPTNLTVDSKSLIANWNAPQQNKQSEYTVNQLDGYIVYLDGDQVAEVASTTLTYTFENLSYGRSYEALVRAKYGDSISGASVYNFESEYLKPISSVTSEYVYGNDFVPLYFIRPFGTIQSIPKGLTAFEIFNNDNLVETIEWDQTSDTIRFTQENMSAGDYVYSVKAIYNLDDYGFPGETGEALAISTDNIHVVISGIDDYQDNAKISIYPNPSNKNISISSEKKINEIRIIDLQGKQVLKLENLDTGKCNVDVSVLKEGSYIVKIIIDKVVISRKLVVL